MKRNVSFRRVTQVEQQRHDLRLNRDVERRDGLVGDDERRIQRQRARDPDALSLAAAEFVRISARVVPLQPDQLEQLRDARAPFVAARRCRE